MEIEPREIVVVAAAIIVLSILIVSVLPPLYEYLETGDIDAWQEAFTGAVVPWWVSLPTALIVIVIVVFAVLGIEELL